MNVHAHIRNRWIRPLAIIGTAGLLLAGCTAAPAPDSGEVEGSGGWDAIVEAAKAEGSVTVYSSQVLALIEAAADAFNEEYPEIQVNIVRESAGTMMARIGEELAAGAPTADVLDVPTNSAASTNPEWFLELDPAMPNLADFPADVINDNLTVDVAGYANLLAFNTDFLDKADVPTTWEDLVDPEWAGLGGLVDPRSSAGYQSWAYLLWETYGDEWLVKLGELNWQIADTGAANAQLIGSGAVQLGNLAAFSLMSDLVKQGAPMDYVMPTPVHAAFQSTGVIDGGENPNAGMVWMNWYMSEAAAEVICAYQMSTTLPTYADECENPLPAEYEKARLVPADIAAKMWTLMGLE